MISFEESAGPLARGSKMDSVFTALHRDALLLDIVDETWAADCLSDDDIDVPNLGGQQEDTDELNGNLVVGFL
jgi:hypothetical protein